MNSTALGGQSLYENGLELVSSPLCDELYSKITVEALKWLVIQAVRTGDDLRAAMRCLPPPCNLRGVPPVFIAQRQTHSQKTHATLPRLFLS